MYKDIIPNEINYLIGNETTDFIIKAKKHTPLKSNIFLILFGAAWLAFTSIFVYAFFAPLLMGQEVHFETNGVPTVASPDNLEPLILPGIIIGVFVLVGVGMLFGGLYSTFKPGGWFASTPTRLIVFNKTSSRSIDWENFTGDIEITGSNENGNITLLLRSGSMVSSKNSGSRYVPDKIYIAGITDAFKIEQIIRKRIKENDPTPTNLSL